MAKKKVRRKRKIMGTAERPRLVVSRSLRYIYGQIIDDYSQKTLVGVTNQSKAVREELGNITSRVEASKKIGEMLASKAKEKGIEAVVFDRNGYKYHGRIKALAEGAREGGLKF